jgi:hypothetical protein
MISKERKHVTSNLSHCIWMYIQLNYKQSNWKICLFKHGSCIGCILKCKPKSRSFGHMCRIILSALSFVKHK